MIFKDNDARKIIDFFKRNGFTDKGIASILGNLYAESGLKSDNAQNSYMAKFSTTDEAYTQAVDGGYWKRPDNGNPFQADSIGYGLCQWTSSGRKTHLYEFSREKRVSISNIDMQLEFILTELRSSYKKTYACLLHATDIREATIQMMVDYERPASKDDPDKQNMRVEYAEGFYDIYFKKESVPMKTLAISAGHYLGTPGKRCLKSIDPNETKEWILNSRVADKVTALLMPYNVNIVRLDDPNGAKEVTLSERAKASNNAHADFYLAIHHNAGINGGKGGGTVVYHYPTSKNKQQATTLYNKLISHTGLKGNRANPIVATTGLYEVSTPTADAILVENGFMDSKTDTPIILTEDHANKTADAIAEFFIEMWGLTKKDIPKVEYVGPTKNDEIQEIRQQIEVILKRLDELEA